MKPEIVYRTLAVFVYILMLSAGPALGADAEGRALKAVLHYRTGLQSTVNFARARPDLFPQTKTVPRVLGLEAKQEAGKAWQLFLEYLYGLDALGREFSSPNLRRKKEDTFLQSYAAFLAGYRFSLEWIELIENDPAYGILFNEAWATTERTVGIYDRLKQRFLNPARAAEFAALEAVAAAKKITLAPDLKAAIESDSRKIWEFGKGKGYALTARNGFSMLEKGAMTAWFPVQASVANWMGDVRVRRGHEFLISTKQIEELKQRLQPGDIFLERREWFVSNVGLPGFGRMQPFISGQQKSAD